MSKYMKRGKSCSVEGCNSRVLAKGFCLKHYARLYNYGRLDTKIRPKGTGCVTSHGYVWLSGKFEHVRIAESALGKLLPEKAVVHHIDGNRKNNNPNNLVVCPDQEYHFLLHKRQEALEGCGNPDYRKCRLCFKFDDIPNMVPTGDGRYFHRECSRRSARNKYRENK